MSLRVKRESGFGLVELLIAMTVMSIGIVALVAGFSSGFGAINRASHNSTAGAIADQQMEAFRRARTTRSLSSRSPRRCTTATARRAVGLPTAGLLRREHQDRRRPCRMTMFGGAVGSAPSQCTDNSNDVSVAAQSKQVTVIVREANGMKELIRESSTFDQSTG